MFIVPCAKASYFSTYSGRDEELDALEDTLDEVDSLEDDDALDEVDALEDDDALDEVDALEDDDALDEVDSLEDDDALEEESPAEVSSFFSPQAMTVHSDDTAPPNISPSPRA